MHRAHSVRHRATIAVTALALAALRPAGAHAQQAPAADAALPPAVEALVRHGVELRQQGRDDDALVEFQRAYATTPAPRVLAQIGLAEQALGRWLAADAHLRQAMAAGGDAWIAHNHAALESSLGLIARQLGRLDVRGGVPGAELWIEGHRAATLPLREPIAVVAGSVSVELRAPGYQPAVRVVFVSPGTLARADIDLQRAPGSVGGEVSVPAATTAAAQPMGVRISPFVWLGTGVAVASGAVAAGFGVAGNTLAGDYAGQCPGRGAMFCNALMANDQPTLNTYQVVANVTLGLSIAGVVVGIVGLVLTERPDHRRPARGPHASITVEPRSAGVQLGW